MRSSAQPSMKVSLWKVILKVGFAAALIYWLVRQQVLNFSALKIFLSAEYLIPCLVFMATNLGLAHWRWVLILRSRGFNLGFFKAFPFTLIGLFFNFAVPGGIGGDLVKGFYVVQEHTGRRTEAALTILVDRIMGLYAMIALGLFPLLWQWQLVVGNSVLLSTAIVMGCAFLFASALGFLALSKRVRSWGNPEIFLARLPGGERFGRLYQALHGYRNNLPVLMQAFVLSLIAQTASIAFMVIVGQAIAPETPLAAYMFAVPIGFIVSALPISPAGIGVGQVAFLFLFNLYTGQRTELGPSVLTAYQVMQFCFSLVGAYFYLTRKQPVKVWESDQ